MNKLISNIFRRGFTIATGYPGAHAFNAVLSTILTLAQTLVFARTLDSRLFALTIAATTIVFYLMPINQSVARGNFVLLRERAVLDNTTTGLPEAAAAIHISQIFFLLVAFSGPFILGTAAPVDYTWICCYLLSSFYNSIWSLEMQFSMLATGRAMPFEILTIVRRLSNFGLLLYLLLGKNILAFAGLSVAHAAIFQAYLTFSVARNSQLFGWPHGLSWAATCTHLWRLWVSLQASLAEWLTMNIPYVVFTTLFGIGPSLVALDAGMKLVRVIVSITRQLCEIVLPRVSRAVFTDQAKLARLEVIGVLTIGVAGAAIVAGAAYFFQDLTFELLLGKNNTVPPGAGAPIAVMVLACVPFATSGHLLGHTGRPAAIRAFMYVAAVSMALSATLTIFGKFSVVHALWVFASALSLISIAGLFLLFRMLNEHHKPKPRMMIEAARPR